MNFTPQLKINPWQMCVRILRSVAICLIPSFLIPISSFAQPVQAPADQCGLRTLSRCAAEIAKDQAGILTSPLRIRKKDFVWIVPFVAATSAAFVFDRKALEQ